MVCAKDRMDYPPKSKKDSSSWFGIDKKTTGTTSPAIDSLVLTTRAIHRLSVEGRPAYIFPTNSFFRGDNLTWAPIRYSFSTHIKYSFGFYPNSYNDRIYNKAYQGIGFASYVFENSSELGNPFALYLFQGARIADISRIVSLNYEWNFGFSFGWNAYNSGTNPYNKVIGSKINAYLNVNFYLSWMLSEKLDLTTGVTLTHFSNGNTKFPNAGLNTTGLKTGLVYNFGGRHDHDEHKLIQSNIPVFPRHISYDLVLFGAWRRTGAAFQDIQIASPEAYMVLGFNFATMYNMGYKLRLGASLDGVYDGSANVYTSNQVRDDEIEFLKPSLSRQLSLGLSARVEYVMPYFTVGLGIGDNFLYGKGSLDACYQILALKIEATRNSFIHIGYSLKNFHEPNFLMLGVGYRFNNKYPVFYRK